MDQPGSTAAPDELAVMCPNSSYTVEDAFVYNFIRVRLLCFEDSTMIVHMRARHESLINWPF